MMIADTGLAVPIVVAGMVGGYSYAIWYRSIRKIGVAPAMALNISYAMWGALFAWSLYHTPVTLLAISGCAVVTAGAVVTILSGRHRPTVAVQAVRSYSLIRPPRTDRRLIRCRSRSGAG